MARIPKEPKTPPQPAFRSAAEYGNSRKTALEAAKTSTPLGFAPSPPSNKMAQLAAEMKSAHDTMTRDPRSVHELVREGLDDHLAGAASSPIPPAHHLDERSLRAGTVSAEPVSEPVNDPHQEGPETLDAEPDQGVSTSLAPELSPSYEELDILRKHLLRDDRRAAIEARLEPMRIEDMILTNEVRQVIPILPGRFEVELRTIQQFENLYNLERLFDLTGSSMYLQELLNMYRLVCSLVSLNDSPIPDHRIDRGTPTEAVDPQRFEHKLQIVSSLATPLLADISVQYDWFIDRVHKLVGVEAVKNG